MMKKIGAHVSAAGGYEKALEKAKAIGADCLQIFSGSPRVWARKPLDSKVLAQFGRKAAEQQLQPVFTHALYLINLASDNPELVVKSQQVLKHDLEFDAAISGSGVVVHLGSHQGRGWAVVREQVAQQIAVILKETPANSTFLIENSAGQKGKLCSDLGEIKWLLEQINSPRLGWCFDTCHGFTAGLCLTPDTEEKVQHEEEVIQSSSSSSADLVNATTCSSALEIISEFNLWEKLLCIHVNDSVAVRGSGRDNHANIGEGKIPPLELQAFLRDFRIKDIPLILEVPGQDGEGPDAVNIEKVKEIVNG